MIDTDTADGAAVDELALRVPATLAVTGAMAVFGVNNVIVRTTDLSGIVTASYRLFLGVGLLVGVLAYFVLAKRARARSDVAAGSFQVGLLVVAAAMTVPLVLASGDVPVVSSTIAWFVLDEHLSEVQWIGAGVTLASLTAVVLRAVRPVAPTVRSAAR